MGIFHNNNRMVESKEYILYLKYSKYEKDNINMRLSNNYINNNIVHIWRNWHLFGNSSSEKDAT